MTSQRTAPHDLPPQSFSPRIPFAITSIHVNPTGKLLAVVGLSQVHICIFPRASAGVSVSVSVSVSAAGRIGELAAHSVDAKAIPLGSFYHNEGSERIAKVDWHPWAQGGASLLVLTEDGILR